MRKRGVWTVGGLILVLSLTPVHAQVTDAQVDALVEALRLSAPSATPAKKDLYSAWQVKPDNIPRWSQRCTGRALSPAEFEANPGLARQIVVCVMGPVLREQFAASRNNEVVAVQRAAAWWMTGDPSQYNQVPTRGYTLKVLEAYLRFF